MPLNVRHIDILGVRGCALDRGVIEDMIESLLACLDELDGDPDLEPDMEGEAEPDEVSMQPLALTSNINPTKRLGTLRRAA